MDLATCSSCGAQIWWAITIGDRRIPIDPAPSPDGTLVPVLVDGKKRVKVLTGVELPAQTKAWVPHFVTCPNSDQHRRRKAVTAPRCVACQGVMDPVLVELGERTHPGCGPPADFRQAVDTAREETHR